MLNWILVIVSLVLVAFAAGSGGYTYFWLKNARSVDGTVVELVTKPSKKGSATYAPKVRYSIDGVQREFTSSLASNPPDFAVGEQVRVATNPQRNQECIATFGQLYGFAFVALFIGAALAASVIMIMNGDKVLKFIHPNLG